MAGCMLEGDHGGWLHAGVGSRRLFALPATSGAAVLRSLKRATSQLLSGQPHKVDGRGTLTPGRCDRMKWGCKGAEPCKL